MTAITETGGGRGVGVHLKCLRCGRSFEHRLKPSGRLPRTCSPECRRARKQGQDQQYRREGRYRPYERRGLRSTYTGTCVVCGLAFSSKNKRTRTCGSKCGAILNGRIRTERARVRNSRRCELCDSAFQPANPSAKQRRAGHQQRFCSSSPSKIGPTAEAPVAAESESPLRIKLVEEPDCTSWRTEFAGSPYKTFQGRGLTPQSVRPACFAFLGRISPEKAVDRAIWIANRCGVPLKIAAKVDAVDREYFESEIRKMLTPPDIEYIGEISDGEKSSFLSGAIAVLAPIAWPEPFGLVLIEAMACGTPVIAFNRGSVPEIVEDGLTGFVVEDEKEAVAATHRLSRLSRGAIRRRFEERFTAKRMAREHLVVYRSLIEFEALRSRGAVARTSFR
jgi:glycosyltransferase involved in cell wall biosynthesis